MTDYHRRREAGEFLPKDEQPKKSAKQEKAESSTSGKTDEEEKKS